MTTESRWPIILDHINKYPLYNGGFKLDDDDIKRLETRYKAGEIEHSGDKWENWSDERFLHEIEEEEMDLLLYRAMRRIARLERASS